MELREMIETATKVTGDQTALAKMLGMPRNNLTDAKAGRRGLPEVACGKLAEILGIDRWTVIAASALVTERNPEKRAYLAPFVLELPRKAAAWVIAIATSAIIGTGAPTDTYANDTLKVSLPTLQPAPLQGLPSHVIGIMSTSQSASMGGGPKKMKAHGLLRQQGSPPTPEIPVPYSAVSGKYWRLSSLSIQIIRLAQ